MGPINVAAVQAAHRKFLHNHQTFVVDWSLSEAGLHAAAHVKNQSKFQRRSSVGSLKDATESKLIRTGGGTLIRIFSTKKTAVFLEEGTSPHMIAAHNARTLRFNWKGVTVFRRYVMHPGTPAYLFLRNATNAAYLQLGVDLRARMKMAAAKF